METSPLDEAVRRGEPLIDIIVKFVDGIDYVAATESFNSLGDDLQLTSKDWHNDPKLRIGSATKAALERLFGWQFKRVPLERYDETTKTWGHWEKIFRWEEICPPVDFSNEVRGFIERISISQPGADDDGQWYE